MTKCFNTQVAEAKDAVTALSPKEAAALQGQAGVVFIDPRPAKAIAASTGIIPGAYNVALDDIENGALPEPVADRAVHVIAACQAGPMGAVAAHAFAKRGFAKVNYVDGGTQGWLDAGYATRR